MDGTGFDPRRYLRTIKTRGVASDYLDVKWRLVWLRANHPDAVVETELLRLDDGFALFRATVTLPSGARATSHGSETRSDFGDFIEKSETKAIGRALAALGFGTQFADDFAMENTDGTPHVVDAPVERPVPVADHYACASCGKEITGTSRYSAHDLAQISIRKHGTVLCLACERKLAREGGGSR